jgi:hypothetical protein
MEKRNKLLDDDGENGSRLITLGRTYDFSFLLFFFSFLSFFSFLDFSFVDEGSGAASSVDVVSLVVGGDNNAPVTVRISFALTKLWYTLLA